MSVGAQLLQARGELKLSLADVTDKTKIQPWVLEALEEDRLQQMMSPIYVKGFLTTYAKFLHLDPDALIRHIPWPQPAQAQEELPPPAPRLDLAWLLPWAPRLATLGAMAVMVAGVVALHPAQRLASMAHHRAKPRPVVAARAKAHPPAPAATSAPAPSAAADAPAAASIAGVKELAPVKPAEPPQMALMPPGPIELTVQAHRTTWLRVRADGKLLAQERLAGGAEEHWRATREFEVLVARPTQVELLVNGQSITPLLISHQGRVRITRRGVSPLPEAE